MNKYILRKFLKSRKNRNFFLGSLFAFALVAAGGTAYFELANKNIISEKNGNQNNVANVNNFGPIGTMIVESPKAQAEKPENFPVTEKLQELSIASNGQSDASHQMVAVSADTIQTNSIETKTSVTIPKSVQGDLDTFRLISMSVEIPNPDRDQTNKAIIICEFSYYEPGEVIPQLEPSFLKINARNIVARVYNKTARMNWLQWELDELPEVPSALMRPKSMNLRCPVSMSQIEALKEVEKSLDENIAPLQEMFADNSPAARQLAYAR